MYIPKFIISNRILKNIGIIEASREVIDNAPLLPFYEREFQKDALIRSVHYGTHIEGNELNLNQAGEIIAGNEVFARDRDIQEVINYRKVIDLISDSGINSLKGKVDEYLIKKIHKLTVDRILLPDKCGKYRKKQVVIRNSTTGEVSFRPPTEIEVPAQVSELIAFINKFTEQDIHPVLKSGVVHYELARIHPFVDGNGRVARALSTVILFIEGYDIRRFFSLEEYFDSDANSYYRALQSVAENDGNLTYWLEYFTQGLAIELSKIKERVERISVDGKLKQKLGGKPFLLTERQLKIIEYIQRVGYLQNQAFNTLFQMVSEDTILNEIKALLKAGIIIKQGVTKGAKYIMA